MPDEQETKKAPEKKEPFWNWQLVVMILLAICLVILYVMKDNTEKTLQEIKENHPAAVANKPAEPQPNPEASQWQAASPSMTTPSAAQPLAVQSQPAVVPQPGAQERLEARFNALESRFNALAPCLENMCRVKTDHHAANPTGKKTPGKGKVTHLASPPNYNQGVPTRQPAFQGQAPFPTGPALTGKSCLDGKCISPSNPNAPNLVGRPY